MLWAIISSGKRELSVIVAVILVAFGEYGDLQTVHVRFFCFWNLNRRWLTEIPSSTAASLTGSKQSLSFV